NVYSPFPSCFNNRPDVLNGVLNPIPKIRCDIKDPMPSRLQPRANRLDDGLNLLPRSFGGTADAAPIPLPRPPKSVNSRPGESQFQEKRGESKENDLPERCEPTSCRRQSAPKRTEDSDSAKHSSDNDRPAHNVGAQSRVHILYNGCRILNKSDYRLHGRQEHVPDLSARGREAPAEDVHTIIKSGKAPDLSLIHDKTKLAGPLHQFANSRRALSHERHQPAPSIAHHRHKDGRLLSGRPELGNAVRDLEQEAFHILEPSSHLLLREAKPLKTTEEALVATSRLRSAAVKRPQRTDERLEIARRLLDRKPELLHRLYSKTRLLRDVFNLGGILRSTAGS